MKKGVICRREFVVSVREAPRWSVDQYRSSRDSD